MMVRTYRADIDGLRAVVDETGLWRAEHGGVSTYCDHDHLTTAGRFRAQPLFEAFFDGLPARP